jgi:[ribosomal protein S18]-alanine N-acetyltransferase
MTEASPLAADIRPLGPFDLGLAAAVHAACFDEAWSTKAIAEILAMPGSFGFIAFAQDKPAGLVIALAAGAEAEILSLGVVPACRRRGIARRLFGAVASRLAERCATHLHLEVAEDNLPGRALYRSLGFAEQGRRPGYYRRDQGRVAALLLERALPVSGDGRRES